MNPIAPIDTLHAVMPSSTGCAPQGCADPLRQDHAELQRLTTRFEQMMTQTNSPQRPGHVAATTAPAEVHESGPNAMGEMLQRQQDLMYDTDKRIDELNASIPEMNPMEMMAATIDIGRQVSLQGFRLQAASSLASSSNKSLQSLLKNS
jgi:type III secretion inner rod protein HrpB2